ncbi:MAG: hypothetical protein JWO36_5967 [Myxococcales bacterium]|nr:hypothetical protein [Myxococcales bacterium]
MPVDVRGLDARQGETVFALVVLRMREPVDRPGLLEILRYLAPLLTDPDEVVASMPETTEAVGLFAIPWTPPETEHLAEQRRLVEGADSVGVEAAWFVQTGTALATTTDDDEDPPLRVDPDGDPWGEDPWSSEEPTGTKTAPIQKLIPDDDELDDHVWSHGPPPQLERVRFPVDGYPAILEELDWEDFGIAFKLAGPALPGDHTVLLGFHSLWLAPYGTRYRNTSVTFDRRHRAAHLWVDRFAVPCSVAEQVHHLLWIASKIDEVMPILHARFGGASMTQKYGGLAGSDNDTFVLGGNPLLAVHASGGEQAVDRWIAEQRAWSSAEVAEMLRETAIEIVTTERGDGDADDEVTGEHEVVDADDADPDENAGRYIAAYAAQLLKERALAGKLDPRAAERLLPILSTTSKYEHRRSAVVEILGAMRCRAAVPRLIQILEDTSVEDVVDALHKVDLLATTANALGEVGDPSAIPVLSNLVLAPGAHNDGPRPAAANALARCLATVPEPRAIDDAILRALLGMLQHRKDADLDAETQLAYGRIAQQLAPEHRARATRMLADCDVRRDDTTAVLTRHAALVLGGVKPEDPRELQALIHRALTSIHHDYHFSIRDLRIALLCAEILPDLVEPSDLTWLTRLAEAEIRDRAHALLQELGHPMPRAPVVSPLTVHELVDEELVRLIGERHVVGRAALIAEAGRRKLGGARHATIEACHDVISSIRQSTANPLEPDAQILEEGVKVLRKGPLDASLIGLFDRMLRSANVHVKWELLQDPPTDERLISSMMCVLAERWGWQGKAAEQWLAGFRGTAAYAAAERALEDGEDQEPDDDQIN